MEPCQSAVPTVTSSRIAKVLWYPPDMISKVRIRSGRLLLNDPGDRLEAADRAALHRALVASQEDLEAGRLVDAEEVLRELRMS